MGSQMLSMICGRYWLILNSSDMAREMIYVGIRLGTFPIDGDVMVATSLSGLCDEIGMNYNTVKSKEWVGDHLMVIDGKNTKAGINVSQIWSLHRCVVKKIEGRGSFRKN